jgi:signal transduction histidine kinase
MELQAGARRARFLRALVAAGALLIAAFLVVAWVLAYQNGDLNLLTSQYGPDLVVPIGAAALGASIAWRPGGNRIGWLFLAIGLVGASRVAAAEYASQAIASPGMPAAAWAAWLTNWNLSLIFPAGCFLFIVLLFPNGRLLSRRWRVVAWAAVLLTAYGLLVLWLDPTPISFVGTRGTRAFSNPTGLHGFPVTWENGGFVSYVGGLAVLAAAAVSLVLRYRRSKGEERQQIKWLAFAVAASVVAIVVTTSIAPVGAPFAANLAVILGLGMAVPVACAIAILKYRLYGIDVVISRTLVYGSLAALITAVYVGIAVGLGSLAGGGGKPDLGLSILATAIVAVGFQPVRARMQKIANRLVYGKRATPYEVLSEFSAHVAETYAAEDVLPRMARVLQEGTGAEQATVWLRSGEQLRPAAASPPSSNGLEPVRIDGSLLPEIGGADRTVAVQHQGDLLGALTVTKRRGESLTPVEQKLLEDLASQAGLVLKNVGLTQELLQRLDELRASRQRLVTAQDDERRKLERNLHDGAQQHLVAFKVKLGLAKLLAGKDPEKARAAVLQLKADADDALETLRDLARGIYPPLLADKGLVAALESQARKATVPVAVEAGNISRYSQEIEAAVYFCVLEALQNVQKYAHAKQVTVCVEESDGALNFAVEDDGTGFDAALIKKGSGLTNMRDRLDALGGGVRIQSGPDAGTRVHGHLPVPVKATAT